MKPSDILSNEHRVIEQVLNCLEKLAGQAEASGRVDGESAQEAIDFFRNFADRCHHGKEESHFFPAMEAKGFSRDCGPTGVMLYEHEQGRRLVSGMAEAVAATSCDDTDAAARFAQHAREFIELLREHIRKEDHCLFTMANDAFTDDDQQQLLDAFAKVESEHIGPEVHQQYIDLANSLARRLGVPLAATSAESCSSCCGH
ncbi:MAG: hemerythrin domain-containing protein [Thermoguttaceae bacterium]|jgi:hemerythrin-like domain-containing protein|nr:hemerythrin domain-containing protein [Thermoguttaceae bacterium]